MKGVVTAPILAAILVEMVTGKPALAAVAFFAVIIFAVLVMTGAFRGRNVD